MRAEPKAGSALRLNSERADPQGVNAPADRRFTPGHRLKTSAEFDHVFAQPWRSGSKYFTVLARTNTLPRARLGLIVSKRCAKSAVKRNRLKRLIRESFRQTRGQLNGVDVVVIGKPAAAQNNDNVELLSVLRRHWRDIKQCKQSSS